MFGFSRFEFSLGILIAIGISVEPDQDQTILVEHDLRLKQVSLDLKAKNKERNVIQMHMGENTFTLGSLKLGNVHYFAKLSNFR